MFIKLALDDINYLAIDTVNLGILKRFRDFLTPSSSKLPGQLCPPPVASFTGRKDILNKMRSYFDTDCASQRIFVLHGLGGAGKSQLSFKFIEESRDKRCAN